MRITILLILSICGLILCGDFIQKTFLKPLPKDIVQDLDVAQDSPGKPTVAEVFESNFETIMNILDYGGYGEEDIIESDDRTTSGVLCFPQMGVDDAGERLYSYYVSIKNHAEPLSLCISESGVIRDIDFGQGMKPGIEVDSFPKVQDNYKLVQAKCHVRDLKEDTVSLIVKNVMYVAEKMSGFHWWDSVRMSIGSESSVSNTQVKIFVSLYSSGIPIYADDIVVVYDYGDDRLLYYKSDVLSKTLPDIPKIIISDQEAIGVAKDFIKKCEDPAFKTFVEEMEWPFSDYKVSEAETSKMFFHPCRVHSKNKHHSAYKYPSRPSQEAVLVYSVDFFAGKRSEGGAVSSYKFSVLVDASNGTVLGLYQIW